MLFLANLSYAQDSVAKLCSAAETAKSYKDIIKLDIIGKLAANSTSLYDYQRDGKALTFYAIDEKNYDIRKLYQQFDNSYEHLYVLDGTDSMLVYTTTYLTTPDMEDDGYTILEF